MLDDTGENPEFLPPATDPHSARIPVRPTLLETIFSSGGEVLAQMRDVLKRVDTVLSEVNVAQINQTLQNVERATADFARVARAAEPAAQGLAPLVGDARNTLQRADALMADLSAATREFATRLDSIDRLAVTAEKAGGAIERAASSADKAGEAIETLANTVTAESLPRINLLAEELARTSRHVDTFVSDIKRQPQSLLFGRKPGAPGPGEPGFDSTPVGAPGSGEPAFDRGKDRRAAQPARAAPARAAAQGRP
jgi:phospholipid/cholesterol/gamma-HCH transport system substrate-binding protein